MTNNTAEAILAWSRPDGVTDVSVDIGTTGIYDVPFDDLRAMARLWMLRDEILEGIELGASMAAAEGFDTEAEQQYTLKAKIESLDTTEAA